MTSPLEITLDSGVVRGRLDRGLRTWRAIPYATAPTGPRRFRAPQPVEAWHGVRPAEAFGSPSPQRKSNFDENSLFVNVVAPQVPSDSLRPVMVFIHGGAYNGGNPSTPMYRGTSLVERGDIVYVSIQYRLGALGYLDFSEYSTAERSFETNLGLRDQIAAMTWVQRNIAAFGGDPNAVTVFGESSGANAVTTLMATPAARGLFARAIAQSPPAASAYGKERAHRWAREFLEIAQAPDTDPGSWLRAASVKDLVAAGEELARRGADEEPGTRAFAPVVGDDVLPEHPLDVFAAGRAHPVPLLVGSNLHEGRIFPRVLDILPTDPVRIEKMFSHTTPEVKARALAGVSHGSAPVCCRRSRRRHHVLGARDTLRTGSLPGSSYLQLPLRFCASPAQTRRHGRYPRHRIACGLRAFGCTHRGLDRGRWAPRTDCGDLHHAAPLDPFRPTRSAGPGLARLLRTGAANNDLRRDVPSGERPDG